MPSTLQSAVRSNHNPRPALPQSLAFFFHGDAMALPDTSDEAKMALIGRQTVLRKARRERVQQIRDVVVPICNSYESSPNWDLSPIVKLVEEVNQITQALNDLS